MVKQPRPTLTLAEVRERQERERAAIEALGLSGRADESPRDLRRLAVIVADLVARQAKRQ